MTCSASADTALVERARRAAAEWRLPYVERPPKSAVGPLVGASADALLVFERGGLTLLDAQGALRFSPGMAALRIKQLDKGVQEDLLVRHAELTQGDAVLDCTLGLAADALVAARAVGPSGRVVGIERSRALYLLVSQGLGEMKPFAQSCRVEPRFGDAAELLPALAAGSFDCVLFDPMFGRPRKSSGSFEVLRRHASYAELTPRMVEEARRVARRWVLIKASRYSTDLKKLGLRALPTGRARTVVWARVPGLGGAA